MKQLFKKYGTAFLSSIAIVIICIIWWINGSELDDAWLYAFSILILLMPTFEVYFKKDK